MWIETVRAQETVKRHWHRPQPVAFTRAPSQGQHTDLDAFRAG